MNKRRRFKAKAKRARAALWEQMRQLGIYEMFFPESDAEDCRVYIGYVLRQRAHDRRSPGLNLCTQDAVFAGVELDDYGHNLNGN